MNVKKGDLAIQIISTCGNEGQIVSILEFSGDTNFTDGVFRVNCWYVEYQQLTPCLGAPDSKYAVCPDAWLRPVSGIPEVDTIDTEHPIEEST